MRSIIQQGISEEERRKKNLMIMGIILVFLMVFSTFGYAFFSSEKTTTAAKEKLSYKGIEFELNDYGFWNFEISGYGFETRYNPQETENISAPIFKNLENYNQKVLYFGLNSKEDINSAGNQEIFKNLNQFVLRNNYACLTEECTEDYPIVNCSNSEGEIIAFEKEPEGFTRVKDNDGCIFIYASEEETVRASDAFLFKILGLQ